MALNIKAFESWLWEAACAIRGPVDAPKVKDYILPLIFLKRLPEVFEDELERLGEEFGSSEVSESIVEGERQQGTIVQGRSSVRFYILESDRWEAIRTHGQVGLGQFLIDECLKDVLTVLGLNGMEAET